MSKREKLLQDLYMKYGDHVAKGNLGRDGLRTIIQIHGEKPPSRLVLDDIVKRVRKEGGPSTTAPSGRAHTVKTAQYLENVRKQVSTGSKTASHGQNEEYIDEDTEEDSTDEVPRIITFGGESSLGILQSSGRAPSNGDRLYRYDPDTGYQTYIKPLKCWIHTSKDAHEQIIEWYSNWDKAPKSINTISRKTGMPRNVVIGYLKVHGITHDCAPFSAEEVMERDIDSMAQDVLALRFGSLAQRVADKQHKAIEKAADNWWNYKKVTLEAIKEHVAANLPSYQPPKLELTEAKHKYHLVTSATDFHWGMLSWEGESGYQYDQKIAKERLIQTTQDLIARLPGKPEGITLAVGSDFFHIDGPGPTKQTTRGTPQDADGTALQIMLTGMEICRMHIDMLAQVAPVSIVLMSGNHDRHNSFALLAYLSAVYDNDPNVDVMFDFRLRVYQEIGNTLCCFTHGDTARVNVLGPIMAKEMRQAWGRCEHHVAFGGHLHHQRIQEIGGIRHYLLPSLASPDAWHAAKGYVCSEQGLLGVLVDMELGPIGSLFAPIHKR